MSIRTDPTTVFADWLGEARSVGREAVDDPVLRAWEARTIESAKGGSHDAYRQLVEHHQDRVYGFCMRWAASPEDAEEVCQDTFVRAFHALPDYRPQGRFSTWLYRIALNLSRDRARSRQGRMARQTFSIHGTGCGTLPCRLPRPDESSERSEELAKLERGLNLLPQKLREPLALCTIDGLSHEECAAVLSCSPRAIEGRIYRARRQLLDWWEATEKNSE